MLGLFYCQFVQNLSRFGIFADIGYRLYFYMRHLPRFVLTGSGCVLVLMQLAACGGGGGGGADTAGGGQQSPSGPSETQSPSEATNPRHWDYSFDSELFVSPDSFMSSQEYQGQIGLSIVNAAQAYARNLAGRNVTIGFTDTGLDATHPEFTGDRVVMNDRSAYSGQQPTDDQLFHGTAVASVAAGNRGVGNGMHGVAFESNIAMWTLALQSSHTLILTDQIFANGLRQLRQQADARIINHSWGYTTLYNPQRHGSQRSFILHDFSSSITEMSQGSVIHVWSAGNERGNQVSVTAAMPLFFPELQSNSVIVVAVDRDGVIGSLSNKCGAAHAICIAAPGGSNPGVSALVRAANAAGGYTGVIGTSFAAPHVSAALALMYEMFDGQLSHSELVDRLFATADKTGIYANNQVYGQGLLNLDAATNPVGPTAVVLDAEEYPVDRSGFNFTIFSDEVQVLLAARRIVLHDSLGAPFRVPLSLFNQADDELEDIRAEEDNAAAIENNTPTTSLTFQAAIGPVHAQAWEYAKITSLAPLVGYQNHHGRATGSRLQSPYLALAGRGLAGRVQHKQWSMMTFSTLTPDDNQASSASPAYNAHKAGLLFGWQTGDVATDNGQAGWPRPRFGFHAGMLAEQESLMGAWGTGAFALSGYGQTFFGGIGTEMQLGQGWGLGFGMYMGKAGATGRALVQNLADVRTQAIDATLWHQNRHMQIYSRLSQPLRVTSGAATLRYPERRLPGGGQVFSTYNLPLSPDGREIKFDTGVIFSYPNRRIDIQAGMRHQPGHDADADNEFSLQSNWRWLF